MTITEKLQALLLERDKFLAEVIGTCGDGGCVVSKPVGQHTNGGCRCSADRMKMQRFAYANNRLADAVAALIAQSDEAEA